MPRTCLCSRLLARAAADVAFRMLPDAARLLWFDILAAASAAPLPGRLRFLHSVRHSVSRLVSRPETEVVTDLRDLAQLGLIDLDPDGVTLWLPGVRDNQARVEAARRNGVKGGAPRKGETKEAARDRRQMEMLLATQGGATQGTEAGTEEGTDPVEAHARAAAAATSLSKGNSSSSSPPAEGGSSAREPVDWVALGQEVAEIAGLDGARGGFNYRPVQAWLNAGYTPDLIRQVVAEVAARPKYDGRAVRGLSYFDDAMLKAGKETERYAEVFTPATILTPEQRAAEQRDFEEMEAWGRQRALGLNPPMPACLARQAALRAQQTAA